MQSQFQLNDRLQALNAFEFDLSNDFLFAVRDIYEKYVKNHLDKIDCPFHEGPYSFYNRFPTYFGSDIRWISPDDLATHATFSEIFDRSGIKKHFESFVEVDKKIQLYSSFFVVRSKCWKQFFHEDWKEVGPNVYTLLAPIYDYGEREFGHLVYHDINNEEKVYRYELGKAIVFGEKFKHSTQFCDETSPAAFICFEFGSDKNKFWPQIEASLQGQARMVFKPDGSVIQFTHEQLTSRNLSPMAFLRRKWSAKCRDVFHGRGRKGS
jgi:hypothetical protein